MSPHDHHDERSTATLFENSRDRKQEGSKERQVVVNVGLQAEDKHNMIETNQAGMCEVINTMMWGGGVNMINPPNLEHVPGQGWRGWEGGGNRGTGSYAQQKGGERAARGRD